MIFAHGGGCVPGWRGGRGRQAARCDTGGVFRLGKPSQAWIDGQLEAARGLGASSPSLLSLEGGRTSGRLPFGFAHDRSSSVIAHGEAGFAAARSAFGQWGQFDLGWVRVANPLTPVARGRYVGVEAQTAGLWSLNISRIMETVDTATRFGFLYATTRMQVEEGEERFVLELDGASGQVWYLIEAVSRPRTALTRVGWPFARVMQHQFARDSHVHMRYVVSRACVNC